MIERHAKNANKTMNGKVKKRFVLKNLQLLMELNVGVSLIAYYAKLLILTNALSVQQEVFPSKINAFVEMMIKY